MNNLFETFSFVKGEYFQYSFTPVLALAVNGTAQVSVTIDNDFHFIIVNVFGKGHQTGTPATILDFMIQINDSSTSKNFFTQDTNSALVVSNSRDTINPLPIHRLAPIRTTLTATVTNIISGQILDIFLSLRGYKLYSKDAQKAVLKRYAMTSLSPDMEAQGK